MPLTRFQRRALLRARELRDKPFPIIGSVLRSWKIYLLLGTATGGYSWWAWSMGAVDASIAALGFFAGLLVRDIAWFRTSARMWPTNVEITDWSKVDKLLDEQART